MSKRIDLDLFCQLYAASTDRELANRFGIPFQSVQRIAREHNLKRAPKASAPRPTAGGRVTVLPAPGFGWGPRTIHRSGV
jgi:hypothetical protein